MTVNLSSLIQRFAGVQPAPGRAHVLKDRLGLIDPGGMRTGAVDEGKMCAEFCITTDDPDRVGDVVNPQGIVLDSFYKNPIGFYGHQVFPLPIGKWEDEKGACTIVLSKHKATGTLYFSQRSKEAAQVFALVAEGILRATSIGFNPLLEPIPRDGRDDNPNSLQAGFYFPQIDLLEASVVGIPAQPTATLVRACLSRDRLAGAPILAPIRKSLEALAEPAPAWSNGASLPPEKPMSKKWGKNKPKLALPQPTATKAPCPPCAKAAGKSIKTALQDCVSRKIPKLLDEGMPHDQAIAAAFSMCGEDGKDLGESSGTAGGYTVPDDDREEDKTLAASIVALTDRITKATATLKQPPPGVTKPDADMPGDGAGEETQPEQQQQQPPMQQAAPKGDPREVLNQLVDALTAYLDLTTPSQTPPAMEEEEEEDEENPEEEDVEDSGGPADEAMGDERYQFRTAKPQQTKAAEGDEPMMKRIKAVCTKAYKHLKEMGEMEEGTKMTAMHKAASLHHHKELMGIVRDMGGEDVAPEEPGEEEEMPDDGEHDHPVAPVNKKGIDDESIDASLILKSLRSVEDRVVAVGNTWTSLNGTMP